MANGTIHNPSAWTFVQDCLSSTKVTGNINLYNNSNIRMCLLVFDITSAESLTSGSWIALGTTPTENRPKADTSVVTEGGHLLFKNSTNNVIAIKLASTISTNTKVTGQLLWVY